MRGGMAYGVTYEFGFQAVENKIHVHHLQATILHPVGIGHQQQTFH